MHPSTSRFPDPDLEQLCGTFIDCGARFVVIGGFAVIANRYVRATEDIDLMIPTENQNDERCLLALERLGSIRLRDSAPVKSAMLLGQAHLRAITDHGLLDLIREGDPPLDFATVTEHAMTADLGSGEFRIAGLRSIVAMKRLADRPRDRNDLAELELANGELPRDPIPGLDT